GLMTERGIHHATQEGDTAVSLTSPVAEHAPIVLQVTALTKRYGGQVALADIALTIRAGEILGLIGPNGAGKTTLLAPLAGLPPADTATMLWRGESLPSARRRDVLFYLPDGMRPYHDQPVARVLAFFAGVYQCAPTHLASVVAAVGLAPVLAKRVQALSKG